MQFPVFKITREDYRGKILRQLANDDCVIFFDTNLFSQLFKLYAGARSEFYNWFNSQPIKARVKIANWSMQEYNNRASKNSLDNYLDGIQMLKTLEKNLNHTGNFLQMFYGTEIRGNSYASKEEFMRDVEIVKTKFKKISGSVKLEANTIENLNNELREHLGHAVIRSDIFAITANIQQEAEFRHLNNIPPGFKDDTKPANKYGDLIIWKEMLAYCKDNGVKNLIFVSNDGKTDIVYYPFVPTTNGKKERMDDVRLPDPRLIDEFWANTTSEELSIINFSTLISLLREADRTSFAEISSAIQIVMSGNRDSQSGGQPDFEFDPNLDITDAFDSSPEAIEATDNIAERVGVEKIIEASEGEKSTVEAINGIPEEVAVAGAVPSLPYSYQALADVEFQDEGNEELSGIATELGSHDWYRQNDAVNRLVNIGRTNTTDRDMLFVIGRRLYSAACGSAFEAINYLQTFEYMAAQRDQYPIEHILNGMLYEIYFDHSNRFRKNRFKAGYIEHLFSIAKNGKFEASRKFIYKALEPYHTRILAFPGEDKSIQVKLTVEEGEVFPAAIEFKIKDIELQGRSIVADKVAEDDPFFAQFGFDPDFRQIREEKLLLELSFDVGVPASQLQLTEKPDLKGKEFAVYTMHKDKTITLS